MALEPKFAIQGVFQEFKDYDGAKIIANRGAKYKKDLRKKRIAEKMVVHFL